jgi:hypothetical protein
MGFAERTSLAGRTSLISFPLAIRRDGGADTASKLDVQITDSGGQTDDPDNNLLFVRVTNSTGTAQNTLLYTDSGLSSPATDSDDSTYTNAGSAYWKKVTTSNGKATLFHKTGQAAGVEGLFHIEVAWYAEGSDVVTDHTFRIVDAADLDEILADTTVIGTPANASIAADIAAVKTETALIYAASTTEIADILTDTGTTLPGLIGTPAADLAADIAAVKTVADAILDDTGTTLDDFIDGEVAAILEDTGVTIPGTITTLTSNVATVDGIVDDILVDTAQIGAAVGASISADIAAVKTVADAIPTTAMRGTDSAALATVLGAVDNGAATGASTGTDTAIAMLKGIIADTNELQADDVPGTLSTLSSAVGNIPTTMVGTNSAALASVLGSAAGASIAADIADIKSDTEDILTDTGTTLNAKLDTVVDAVGTLDSYRRWSMAVPQYLQTGEATDRYQFTLFLRDHTGAMDNPDTVDGAASPKIKIVDQNGNALNANMYDATSDGSVLAESSSTYSGYYHMVADGTGKFSVWYEVASGHADVQLLIDCVWKETEDSVTTEHRANASTQVSDSQSDVNAILADTNALQTDWANDGRLDLLLDAIPTTAMRGTDSAALASVMGALDNAAASGASSGSDTAIAMLKGIIADTNALQTDWANDGRLDLLLDAIPTTAMRGTDSAALASVMGALDDAAIGAAAGDNDTAMSLLKGIITDTNELQGDWADDGRLDVILDAILDDTGSTLPGTLNTLTTSVGTVDTVVDAIQVDLGNFSGNTNLQSSLAVLGTGFESANLSLSSTQLMANSGVRLYQINSYSGEGSPLSGTFTLGNVTGGHEPLGNDGYYTGGIFVSVEDGKQVSCTGYTASSRTVAFTDYAEATSLASGDLVAFFPDAGFIGSSDDQAASSSSDAGKSVFSRLRYIAGVVEGLATPGGAHHSTFTKYLVNDTTVLSADPTDTAVAVSQTNNTTAYKVLKIVTIQMDEAATAEVDDIFVVFKWRHQGTANAGTGAIKTKWMISGTTETEGSAPSTTAPTAALDVTSEIVGSTTATTTSLSGTLPLNAISYFSNMNNGTLRFMLVGKVTDQATDVCTTSIFQSSSVEISYHVS